MRSKRESGDVEAQEIGRLERVMSKQESDQVGLLVWKLMRRERVNRWNRAKY